MARQELKQDESGSVDVKEVLSEVTSFFRFDLRRRGHVIDVMPFEEGWEVQAELLDFRPDLSTSYKQVFDQNIYRIRLTEELKISSCEKIGTRNKEGEIRYIEPSKAFRSSPSQAVVSRSHKPIPEKKIALDASIVRNLADEISNRVSSSLARLKGAGSGEEPVLEQNVFIDPHQESTLDFNFDRVGKLEQQEEGDLPEAIERLKRVGSKNEKTVEE